MKPSRKIHFALLDFAGWVSYRKGTHRFNCSRYPDAFFYEPNDTYQAKKSIRLKQQLKKVLYCFWTGDNEMTPNRRRSIDALKSNTGVQVILITPETLPQYILPDHPLHKSYPYLSLVHKSDYLRTYFMHHYGGGYTDIKTLPEAIDTLYDELSDNDEKWILGYPEINIKSVVDLGNNRLGWDLKKQYRHLLGNCAYICKSHSPFTTEWYSELHRRLDSHYDQLQTHPGNTLGDNAGYPLGWTSILGEIFHPLCLKYSEKTIQSKQIRPLLRNYR
jgi:hypothetical protein